MPPYNTTNRKGSFYNKQFVTQKFPRIFTDDLLRPLATNYYPETLRRPDLLTHLADTMGQKCSTKVRFFAHYFSTAWLDPRVCYLLHTRMAVHRKKKYYSSSGYHSWRSLGYCCPPHFPWWRLTWMMPITCCELFTQTQLPLVIVACFRWNLVVSSVHRESDSPFLLPHTIYSFANVLEVSQKKHRVKAILFNFKVLTNSDWSSHNYWQFWLVVTESPTILIGCHNSMFLIGQHSLYTIESARVGIICRFSASRCFFLFHFLLCLMSPWCFQLCRRGPRWGSTRCCPQGSRRRRGHPSRCQQQIT